MSEKTRAYLYLHISVFIWGFTAILGKKISLAAVPLVWWRVVICCTTLFFIMARPLFRMVQTRMLVRMFLVGMIVGLHWLCFYGAIKYSNASIAVTTMATTSLFSSVIEPVLLRQRLKWYELMLGILILPGMMLVVGSIDLNMRFGLFLGIVGAFLAAVFTALNKQILETKAPPEPLLMSFTQMAGGILVTSLGLLLTFRDPGFSMEPRGADWIWILLLAWVCTLLPYYLSLIALRQISAFAANLTLNLEPVYGVALAALIYQEHQEVGLGFYIGVCIILMAVFGHPLLKGRFEPKTA